MLVPPSSWRSWLACGVGVFGSAASALAEDPMPVPAPVVEISPEVVPSAGEVVMPGGAATPGVNAPGTPCATCPPPANVFKNAPPSRPVPRPGNFSVPPTGPGIYSLLDAVRGAAPAPPPKYPYPRNGGMAQSFFDSDFRYLDDPKNTEHDYADTLKRIPLGENWLLSNGGELRNRQMSEYNSRAGQVDNNYNLSRARTYLDLLYKDQFRFFVELNASYSVNQDLPALAVDESGPDFQNLFVDVKTFDYKGKPVYVRVGRQELLLGSQRLISTLDWVNTRRTFQGVRAFRTGEKWDFDAFWLQVVVPQANKLDSGDNNQNFMGGWLTYRPKKGTTVDFYSVVLDNTNDVTQQRIQRSPLTVATTGARFAGDSGSLLYDFEGGVQSGRRGDQEIAAGFATAGVGKLWKDTPLSPTLWLYYDYASGDSNPGVGRYNTFNQLYPFGHYYLGWADIVGRQNIHDISIQHTVYPTRWLTVYAAYHRFFLDSSRDALYNIAGNAIRRDATGTAGNDVGREFDIITNTHISKHVDLLAGYSYLFGGKFLKNTGAADSSTAFVQMTYRW